MKPKKVYLLSGPPASGKSTWIRAHLTPGSEWISRDNVRFSIVSEGEEYFSHEDEVFDTFIAYINQTLENPEVDTISGATRTSGAIKKLLINVMKDSDIYEK